MLREEAKKRLEVWQICRECPEDKQCYDSHLHSICEYDAYSDEVSISEAVKVAIKALEQEPCEDCISREYILSKAHCCRDDLADDEPCCVDVDDIKNAPSVQPKPKTGHWINKYHEVFKYYCDKCGTGSDLRTPYCPNCGAKMESEEV